MSAFHSRRDFLSALGAAAAACLAGSLTPTRLFARTSLYPPMDLSHFDSPIPPAPAEIKFGYAAITWGGNDRQAIEDIAALGFPGIQLRSNCIAEFASPAALRDLLQEHELHFVALSSGGVNIDAPESEEIAKHLSHAKFLREAGGIYLQVTDDRPSNRSIAAADRQKLGRLLSELGKRTADLGIPLGYHNHMGSLGEHPEEVAQILESSDPRYLKLELDIAHYFQGGGDPVKAIETYRDRLLFLHFKDVEPLPAGEKRTYRFVELGRGRVDVPAVLEALRRVHFRGWAIVELDAVPDSSRTPKTCAEINKRYLQDKLRVTL